MQYNRLGHSGLKISRIILGGMAFGSPNWEGSPWTLDEASSLAVIKRAYDLGINTWDTANTYSNGRSEIILGKALQQFGIPRSKVVILSKLYYPVMDDESRPQPPDSYSKELVNQMGLSRKHIFDAVDASLARLNTTYIDVLQLHRLDRETSPEEIMRALHDLVCIGKVHYIGASSMHTWEFARLQYTAKMHGWTGFTSMQPFYNLLYREEEREMLPFCASEGIGVIPWSPLARGLLAKSVGETSERNEADAKSRAWFGDAKLEIVRRVEEVAKRKGVSMASVATAWVMRKGYCPIVGLTSMERVDGIMESLGVEMSDEECRHLEEAYRPRAVLGM
ncbi:voltage-gated potassium channel subunit beta-2 [Lindgomyces ingoldianus]|uniref:Voltage-gated potassium channel subunit beta-2 n=1 Tax=Lindgomyces ingoldianus TaxID=673940 RepID=A0ACB6R9M2_9PLEO|nr:voltage-gated potassium channel subunit beta-2 [Lindgomyces ingoldianus]KAF2475964.1 voltage-gated potassium channel subunit beta-2 [Lindgomyces ingoldianus]